MATGRALHNLTYEQMVAYVATQITPLEVDMKAHDEWHLDQLTIAQRADRAVRWAAWGVWIAGASLVSVIVLALVHHH